MTNDNITILNQLTAVNLNVSIWTARQKLTTEDFGGAELPPEELASLGSKKICDPERLRIFSTLKARAVNQLDKIGVRFLGGWAIPDDQNQFIYDRLLEVKNEFLLAKDDFLSNYDLAVKIWVDKHPGWERLIRDSPVSVEQVRKRFAFDWQFYKVVQPDQGQSSENLMVEVNSLGSTLFGEIAKDAQSVWTKVFNCKTEVSHKALSPLRSMSRKLISLSFVEPTVAPVASLIEEAISSVPKRGLIKGQHLLTLQGLVTTLKDPSLLFEYGQKVLNGQGLTDILSLESSSHDELETDDEMEDQNPLDLLDESSLPFELPKAIETIVQDDSDNGELSEYNNLDEDIKGVNQDSDSSSNKDDSNNTNNQNQDAPFVTSLGLW
jgi:hypothetical protein